MAERRGRVSRCLAARRRPETATAAGENVFLLARAANFAREQIEGRVAPLRGHLNAFPKTADNETFLLMGQIGPREKFDKRWDFGCWSMDLGCLGSWKEASPAESPLPRVAETSARQSPPRRFLSTGRILEVANRDLSTLYGGRL